MKGTVKKRNKLVFIGIICMIPFIFLGVKSLADNVLSWGAKQALKE